MKKKYLGFGLVYCVLVLLIFLAAISVYTKKKIDEQNDSLRSISRWPEFRMAYADCADEEALVGSTIDSWEFLSRLDDIGVYSSVVETNNGGVLIESKDYFLVRYYGEFESEVIENSDYRYEEKTTQLAPGDYRFMVLEEPVSLTKDELTDLRFPGNNVTITGARCDDTFIYGGTLTFTTNANEEKTFTITISNKPGTTNNNVVVSLEYEFAHDEVTLVSGTGGVTGGGTGYNAASNGASGIMIFKSH